MELTKNTSVDPAKRVGTNYIDAVNIKFPNTILDEEWSTTNQVTLTIKTNMLPDVVSYLYYEHEGWLPLVFGNDERSINGHYAVYYVLSMEGEVKSFVTIKALVDPVSLEFPSVTPKVKAAVWGERELFDMYGLKAVGLPDQRRLPEYLLPYQLLLFQVLRSLHRIRRMHRLMRRNQHHNTVRLLHPGIFQKLQVLLS